jgi:hypothetical protein
LHLYPAAVSRGLEKVLEIHPSSHDMTSNNQSNGNTCPRGCVIMRQVPFHRPHSQRTHLRINWLLKWFRLS